MRRLFCLFLIFVIVLCSSCAYRRPPIPPQVTMDSDYVAGLHQGEKDAVGKPDWAIAGIFLGPLGAGIAYGYEPRPPIDALVGKSQEYVMAYEEAYILKTRSENTNYAFTGWAAWILFYALITSDVLE